MPVQVNEEGKVLVDVAGRVLCCGIFLFVDAAEIQYTACGLEPFFSAYGDYGVTQTFTDCDNNYSESGFVEYDPDTGNFEPPIYLVWPTTYGACSPASGSETQTNTYYPDYPEDRVVAGGLGLQGCAYHFADEGQIVCCDNYDYEQLDWLADPMGAEQIDGKVAGFMPGFTGVFLPASAQPPYANLFRDGATKNQRTIQYKFKFRPTPYSMRITWTEWHDPYDDEIEPYGVDFVYDTSPGETESPVYTIPVPSVQETVTVTNISPPALNFQGGNLQARVRGVTKEKKGYFRDDNYGETLPVHFFRDLGNIYAGSSYGTCPEGQTGSSFGWTWNESDTWHTDAEGHETVTVCSGTVSQWNCQNEYCSGTILKGGSPPFEYCYVDYSGDFTPCSGVGTGVSTVVWWTDTLNQYQEQDCGQRIRGEADDDCSCNGACDRAQLLYTETYTNEYLTDELIQYTEDSIPDDWPEGWGGSASAIYYLDTAYESACIMQLCQYKFVFNEDNTNDRTLVWYEKFQNQDYPINTILQRFEETIPAGSTESSIYEIDVPGELGERTVVGGWFQPAGITI
jgi:hypothetical protein